MNPTVMAVCWRSTRICPWTCGKPREPSKVEERETWKQRITRNQHISRNYTHCPMLHGWSNLLMRSRHSVNLKPVRAILYRSKIKKYTQKKTNIKPPSTLHRRLLLPVWYACIFRAGRPFWMRSCDVKLSVDIFFFENAILCSSAICLVPCTLTKSQTW